MADEFEDIAFEDNAPIPSKEEKDRENEINRNLIPDAGKVPLGERR